MTLDYLLFAAPHDRPAKLPTDLAAALRHRGCTERWRGGRLVLSASPELPLRRLVDRSGFVVGHVFDAAGVSAADELQIDLSGTGAEAPTARIWGSYAAFSEGGGGLLALRDPSGGLACYHARVEGFHCFTSLPHLLVDCGLITAEIDWSAIGRSLTRHAARPSVTALRGIDELAPGHLMRVAGGEAETRPVWDPWRHVAPSDGERGGDDAAQLDRTLCSTLGAWGRAAKRPLIEISGGLDSAVVAAGMARAAAGASLITFAAAPGDPDETIYARAIADHLGLPLEIASPRIEDVDLTRSLSGDLPRPNARAFTQAADAQSLRHARAIGTEAFVSGGGGDDVFCYLRSILPALDRLQAEGVWAMMATAREIAVMNHSTLWEALTRVRRRLVHGPARGKGDLRFLNQTQCRGFATEASDASIEGRPQGKAAHIKGIVTIHNYLEGHARADFAPILSPLLSQPIVEACLAIPSWRWCENGRNRAVARRAFAGRLPRSVLERRSKGSFDGFCARLLHCNRPVVRDLLLDGRLAREGMLDRIEIAAALQQPSLSAPTVSRLLALVDVESWIGCWTSRPRQRG